MGKPRSGAVYNSPIPAMPWSTPRTTMVACLLFCLLAVSAFAERFREPEQELAQKILAAAGNGPATIDVVNRSSLSPAEVDQIREGFYAVLSSSGLTVVAPTSGVTAIRISLSESLQGYIWVAQVQRGADIPNIILLPVARTAGTPTETSAARFAIHKTLLWSQKDRILDLAVAEENPRRMLVLGGEQVKSIVLRNGGWEQQGTANIAHRNPWPRDLRGHLVRRDGMISAFLPGLVCDLPISPNLGANCRESSEPWPLAPQLLKSGAFFAPSRNYFTAFTTADGRQLAAFPFYSAAPVNSSAQAAWVTAGADGQVHMVSGLTDHRLGGLLWGGDIAAVQSLCGTKWQILATASGDSSTDSVQAYEVSARYAAPVSNQLEFMGRITALWSDWDEGSAVAVTQNRQTGMYEAYRLTLACSE